MNNRHGGQSQRLTTNNTTTTTNHGSSSKSTQSTSTISTLTLSSSNYNKQIKIQQQQQQQYYYYYRNIILLCAAVFVLVFVLSTISNTTTTTTSSTSYDLLVQDITLGITATTTTKSTPTTKSIPPDPSQSSLLLLLSLSSSITSNNYDSNIINNNNESSKDDDDTDDEIVIQRNYQLIKDATSKNTFGNEDQEEEEEDDESDDTVLEGRLDEQQVVVDNNNNMNNVVDTDQFLQSIRPDSEKVLVVDLENSNNTTTNNILDNQQRDKLLEQVGHLGQHKQEQNNEQQQQQQQQHQKDDSSSTTTRTIESILSKHHAHVLEQEYFHGNTTSSTSTSTSISTDEEKMLHVDDNDNDNTSRTVPNSYNLNEQHSQQEQTERKEQTISSQQIDNENDIDPENSINDNNVDPDKDCPFRNSSIYRKVYVYPSPNNINEWTPNVLSTTGLQYLNFITNNNNTIDNTFQIWPWIEYEQQARQEQTFYYNVNSNNIQYSTEVLIRELVMNPKSCLRTYNPDDATLFYVPYMPAMEHHMGTDKQYNFTTSIYATAIENIISTSTSTDTIDNNNNLKYDLWETVFGLTSKYWKQRKGTDHILVFSEPLHGLSHPRNKRGNYHYIQTQKQLSSAIIISVELSTSFIQLYPHCTSKNILLPYPNTVGSWYNSIERSKASTVLSQLQKQQRHSRQLRTKKDKEISTIKVVSSSSSSIVPVASNTSSSLSSLMMLNTTEGRYITQFYSANNHGTCTKLRKAMQQDYKSCSNSYKTLTKQSKLKVKSKSGEETEEEELDMNQQSIAMRLAKFCPCPGGDSPGAKRMFDSILAGCIPVILSYDFVWPFSTDLLGPGNSNSGSSSSTIQQQDDDTSTDSIQLLNPNDFSIRLNAKDYDTPLYNPETCVLYDNTTTQGLETTLQSISTEHIQQLQYNIQYVATQYYNWYKPHKDLPNNLLLENILPDGGLAHHVVASLAQRASGKLWASCQKEVQDIELQRQLAKTKKDRSKLQDPNRFVC